MSPNETCPKCRKPTSSGSGSITQWISVCKCSELGDSEKQSQKQKRQFETTQICRTCGKHIGGGRPGSFTQYIFRHDLCKCEKPDPTNEENLNPNEKYPKDKNLSNTNLNASQKDRKSTTTEPAASEEELSLDEPDKFPLQRYKPLSLLGRGAAGSVYLCRDRLLGKKVAVKTLNKLSAEQLVSFQLEAKAASRVKHQYIVMVLDFGATESGCPFMVMEYVNGTSLAQLLEERGALETDLAIAIGIKVCDALEYVHQHEMFHRDLKPSNILLVQHDSGDQFDVRLIDFGVAQAKFDTQEPTMFQGRTVVGTPNYMSPDQVSGKRFDARSEVYSLGCVLFELLTGTPPFVTHSALETISKHAHEAPPALSDFTTQEFPEKLELLVAKCLEKRRSNRYQSMAELRSELATASDSEVVVAASAPVIDAKSTSKPPIPGYFKVLAGMLSLTLVAIISMAIAEQNRPIVAKKATKIKRTFGSPPVLMDQMFYDKLNGPIHGLLSAEPDFADEDMKSILRFSYQTQLSLAGSQVTGKNFSVLQKLPLKILNLSKTKIDDKSLAAIGALTDLEDLKLSHDSIGDEGIKHLSSLHNLKILNLDYTQVTDSGLTDLSDLPALTTLNLDGCKNITSAGLVELAKSSSLRMLYLTDCPRIPRKDLAKLSRLNKNWRVAVTLPPVPIKTMTLAAEYSLKNPVFAKFMRYRTAMYGEEFRTFFRNPRNWDLKQSEMEKIKNKSILQCLNDRDYMQDPKVKKLWMKKETWEFMLQRLAETENSFNVLSGPMDF